MSVDVVRSDGRDVEGTRVTAGLRLLGIIPCSHDKIAEREKVA